MVSHWSLYDGKSSHVSRTFLSILADLNNAYLPTPPLGQDMTHGQFLSGV